MAWPRQWRAARSCFCKSVRFKVNCKRKMHGRRLYHLPFPDKPVYLSETWTQNADSKHNAEHKLTGCVSSFFSESLSGNCLVIAEQDDESESRAAVDDYITSCLAFYELKRFHDCREFDTSLGTAGGSGGKLKRCLLFSANRRTPSDLSAIISKKSLPKDVLLYKVTKSGQDGVFLMTKMLAGPTQEVVRLHLQPDHCQGGSPQVSPIFGNPEFSPVYHSLERTLQILSTVGDKSEVQALLEIGRREIPDDLHITQLQSHVKHNFLVVEGMDASGKTTLTGKLEKKLQAVRCCTPPPCIQHLRKFFDRLPEIVRRAYYSIGNYIVAVQIAKECQHRAVIMDRFWHSTAAYGIANETSLDDLPPVGHVTYEWPSDLLKPTCVLFLNVTEEVRCQRMNLRNESMTYEETALDRDALFRQRLCEAYKRMQSPSCMEINACGSVEDVVKQSMTTLLEHGVKLH